MTILDACVVVNLINGGVLDAILLLPEYRLAIGPQVRNECSRQHQIIDASLGNTLRLVSDNDIPASFYFELLAKYELGFGETECLALAFVLGAEVCTDDQRARKMCEVVLGNHRVFGSARLLKEAVKAGLLSASAAFEAYELMKTRGAFLPALLIDYFEL